MPSSAHCLYSTASALLCPLSTALPLPPAPPSRHRNIDRKDILLIEHLIRKGRRQLELLSSANVTGVMHLQPQAGSSSGSKASSSGGTSGSIGSSSSSGVGGSSSSSGVGGSGVPPKA